MNRMDKDNEDIEKQAVYIYSQVYRKTFRTMQNESKRQRVTMRLKSNT